MKKFTRIFLFLYVLFTTPILLAALPNPIRFATQASYPPFESINAAGDIVGFDVDIMNALCQQIATTTCTLTHQAWESLIPGLKLGKFDALIGGMNITEERKKQVDFTAPYYPASGIFVALTGKYADTSPANLKGKTIGVESGTTFPLFLAGEYPDVKIKSYISLQDAFLDLISHRIDIVLGDEPAVMNWLKNNDKTHRYATIGKPIINEKYFGSGYGIAVKKGNTELLDTLNKALAEIKKQGEYQTIVKKYFVN